jgi:hypothetical protein
MNLITLLNVRHGLKMEIDYLAFWKLPPKASSVSSPEIEICHENSKTPKPTKIKTAGFSLICSNVVQKSDEAMMR